MKIGKMLILPSNFTGSQRFLKQNYMDSMSIVNRYEKPDLFITMTCNPNWKEISENNQKIASNGLDTTKQMGILLRL